MRRIGLLGGISSKATALFYERINALIRSHLGAHNSGELLVSSPNVEPLIELWRNGAFDVVAADLADDAEALVRAGAEVIVVCADPTYGASAAVAARLERLNAQQGVAALQIDPVVETM